MEIRKSKCQTELGQLPQNVNLKLFVYMMKMNIDSQKTGSWKMCRLLVL